MIQTTMIVIIDYGLGNVGSIKNMLKKIGIESRITDSIGEIEKADKIILPGVGKFDAGMQGIRERGLLPVLNNKVLVEKVPLLGICLGMQILTDSSDEGKDTGLGWIHGVTKKFILPEEYKIPHMGWNTVDYVKRTPLTLGVEENERYYFVHSYYVKPKSSDDILMQTNYGKKFASAIYHDNIYGVQFHPEKSHKYGIKLLGNFAKM